MGYTLLRGHIECYRGLYIGTIQVNIFINYLEKVMEPTFIRFADDTKLEGTVDMLADRAAIQSDLRRLKERSNRNLRKFSKDKFPSAGKAKTLHWYRLGLTGFMVKALGSPGRQHPAHASGVCPGSRGG